MTFPRLRWLHPPALDEADQNHNDGDDEQKMNQPAPDMKSEKSKQPQNK